LDLVLWLPLAKWCLNWGYLTSDMDTIQYQSAGMHARVK